MGRMLRILEDVSLIRIFTACNGENDGLRFLHLLIVDDTILFCDANPNKFSTFDCNDLF